jgi:serine/threonine protein kinase
MTCPMCGTANAADAAFCANCGSGLAAAPAVATAEAAPHAVMEPGGDDLLDKVKQHLGGDYAIEKELGRGGMAVVYKGVERALERVVAIKVVPPESANAGQAAERFRREARLAASLDHANIIPVYRVGTAGPLHFMAMKFVEGRAVDAIIESQGALPINVAIAILRYSAAGLAFAHEKKIVHRDIKGANILVDKDGRVMVSDFGIARALEEVSLTASGMVIGTPYYMSPEQCGGQKISPQSDQYSLGILGFQMLTGEVPFNADSMVGVIQHHYMTPVPDIRAVRSDVPQELLDIIYCSLNKAPEDRFTTTKEMAQALDAIPQTDAEREEAERVLRELSAGKTIPKVRTGTLPPLTLTISGPAAPVVPRPVAQPKRQPTTTGPTKRRKKKKKNKMLVPMVMMLVGGGGAAGYYAMQNQGPVVSTYSHLSFPDLPDTSAVVTLGGVRYRDGDSIQAGRTVVFQASLSGYQNTSKEVLLTAGKVDSVTFDWQQDVAANQPVVNQPINQPAQTRPQAPAGGAAPVQQNSSEKNNVNIVVNPLTTEIWVDDEKKGAGRLLALPLSLGPHKINFRSPNGCNEERRIIVDRGPQPTVSVTMSCSP